jgi:anaerobic ribonucleoside-triphosphate reductase activating protein
MRIVYPLNPVFQDWPGNPSSLALAIVMAGCEHNCDGCHTPWLQDYESDRTIEVSLKKLLYDLDKRLVVTQVQDRKIVITGGDPISPRNIEQTKELLKALSHRRVGICIYSGYEIDYVKKNEVQGFTFIKCGKYLPELRQEPIKTDEFIRFASKNQKLYDANFHCISSDGVFYF